MKLLSLLWLAILGVFLTPTLDAQSAGIVYKTYFVTNPSAFPWLPYPANSIVFVDGALKVPGVDFQTKADSFLVPASALKAGSHVSVVSGLVGLPGTNGTNGTNGANGADGAVGANGTNGINGVNGADGKDGQIGQMGPPGPAGSSFTNIEEYGGIPGIGVINGGNATFVLSQTPAPGTIVTVYRNGMKQDPKGGDYTRTGTMITFAANSIPQTGDKLAVNYWMVPAAQTSAVTGTLVMSEDTTYHGCCAAPGSKPSKSAVIQTMTSPAILITGPSQ